MMPKARASAAPRERRPAALNTTLRWLAGFEASVSPLAHLFGLIGIGAHPTHLVIGNWIASGLPPGDWRRFDMPDGEGAPPSTPELLSVEDGCDVFWRLMALLDRGVAPRAVSFAVNAAVRFAPPITVSVEHPRPMAASGRECDATLTHGASVAAFWHLLNSRGYSMVLCDRPTGVTCYAVRGHRLPHT